MKHTRAAFGLLVSTTALSLATCAFAHGVTVPFNANDPASTGYAMTFSDDFNSLDTIDVNASGKPGYKWYTKQFFGGKPSPPESVSVRKGVLTIDGPHNGSIATAGPADSAQGWVGSVFGDGAYFEAAIAFDPKLVDTKKGWPSFWSMAVEHMALKDLSKWEGMPDGYERFIENDFFEFDTADWAGKNTYGGAVHDTYGKWSKEKGFSMFSNENFVIRVPENTDFTKFHRYGNLWVPATKENGWRGFIQYYFDGLPTSDIVAWNGKSLPGTSPLTDATAYAIADKAHLVVLLGCGPGQKMRVDYVRVWQPPTATEPAAK
ncbi:MAG TPA: hypothetical protein VGK19_01065 [Capsulimonadaceae bacterium]|jgi:hypothetical protein